MKALADAEGTIDQQKAKSLFWRAEDILADDLPTIPCIIYTAQMPRFQGCMALSATRRTREMDGTTNNGIWLPEPTPVDLKREQARTRRIPAI